MPDESVHFSSQTVVLARYVFVYGTLRRGGSNDITRLTPTPRWVGEASVLGWLYTLGSYPGMRLSQPGGTGMPVVGEVYAITPELENRLDLIEGLVPGALPQDADEYARREVRITVQGTELTCLMYEIHPRFAVPQAHLAHGDWLLCMPRVR